jgi:hypothetical protein
MKVLLWRINSFSSAGDRIPFLTTLATILECESNCISSHKKGFKNGFGFESLSDHRQTGNYIGTSGNCRWLPKANCTSWRLYGQVATSMSDKTIRQLIIEARHCCTDAGITG